MNADRFDPPLDAAIVGSAPVVDVGGVAVRLSASDETRADAVAALFRHSVRASGPAECELRFTSGSLPVPPVEPIKPVDDLEVWRCATGELFVRRPRWGIVARATGEEVIVAGDAPALAREFRYLAQIALTHTLAFRDLHVIHAGAIVYEGKAVLVLGGSGSGKSTLVVGALRSGWTALADDLVVLSSVNGLVRAVGLARPISIPLDVTIDEFARGVPVPDDPRNRVELPGSALASSSHGIGGTVVVGHADDAVATVEPMDPHDCLRAVLGASASIADPRLLRDVFVIAAAVARRPAWTFRHGTDPATRLDEAGRCLGDVRRLLGARN